MLQTHVSIRTNNKFLCLFTAHIVYL